MNIPPPDVSVYPLLPERDCVLADESSRVLVHGARGPQCHFPPISLWTCSIYHGDALLPPVSESNVTLYSADSVLYGCCRYCQPRLKHQSNAGGFWND